MGGKNNRICPKVGRTISYGVEDAVLVIRKAPASIFAWIRMNGRSNNIDINLALEDESNVCTGVLVSYVD